VSDVPDREAIRTDWYPVAVRWLIHHSQAFAHVTRWLRSGKAQQRNPNVRPVPRVSLSEYAQNLTSIIELVRSRHTGVIVIGAPYRDSKTNPPEAELMTSYRATARTVTGQQAVPYLEILELTEAAGPVNQGFFGELIHPNHMGHRLMASELLKLMAKNKMLGDMKVPELVP
jgi:lysophospholipase L1-like esterase